MNALDAKMQQILRNYGDDVESMPDDIRYYYLAHVNDRGTP